MVNEQAAISFLQCRWEIFPDRGSLALFGIFVIRLPVTVTVEFSQPFQAKLLGEYTINWPSKKQCQRTAIRESDSTTL